MSGYVGEDLFGDVGQHGVVRQATVVQDDDGTIRRIVPASLNDRFVLPPFTVLDTRSGDWQARKGAWVALGIQSELGRDATSYNFKDWEAQKNGSSTMDTDTSVFDPVICELAYQWWCRPGGRILDPFAGGSVRGIVASKLGLSYTGVDLSERQVEANRDQARAIVPDNQPTWVVGDSRKIRRQGYQFDFLFSCPPYSSLEVYSDDPADLSQIAKQQGYQAFIEAYRDIIGICVGRLKDDCFAAFVVGNLRDSQGHLHNFIGDTIEAFEDAGMRYYNDAVLVSPVGTARMRVSAQFDDNRKLGRLHQMLVVFVKGDSKQAVAAIKEAS